VIPHEIRRQLRKWQECLASGNASVSPKDLRQIAALLDESLLATEETDAAMGRLADDLDGRLLAMENSRFFRLLRWPGRLAAD
jgi:hypothetical protein